MPPAPGAAGQASGAMRAASSAVESSLTTLSSQSGARWNRWDPTGGRRDLVLEAGDKTNDEKSKTNWIYRHRNLVDVPKVRHTEFWDLLFPHQPLYEMQF